MHQLRTALKCCASSIEATAPDSLGHIFCHLQCEAKSGCKDMNFCLKVKRVVEEELNRRAELESNPTYLRASRPGDKVIFRL